MTLEHITNHIELAEARTLEQYKHRPVFEKFLSTPVDEVQNIEDDLWQLYTKRWIDKAEGFLLDVCGKIVGIERSLRSDDEYRIAIYAQIEINVSGGEPESIINAMKQVFGDDCIVTLKDIYPANFRIDIVSNGGVIKNLRQYIDSLSPAGTGDPIITQCSGTPPLILGETKNKTGKLLVNSSGVEYYLAVDSDGGEYNVEIEYFGGVDGDNDWCLGETYIQNNDPEQYTLSAFGGKLGEVF